jgi:hypothetical protein
MENETTDTNKGKTNSINVLIVRNTCIEKLKGFDVPIQSWSFS